MSYGKFTTDEARLINYNAKGEYAPYIDIEDEVFFKYFYPEFSQINCQTINNTIFNASTDLGLSFPALQHIWELDYFYGNLDYAEVPRAEANLTRKLDEIIRRQENNGFGSLKDIDVTLDFIANNYSEFRRQSEGIGVPKELIASVLFREMMTLSTDDWFDGNDTVQWATSSTGPINTILKVIGKEMTQKGMTLGNSQISVEGAKKDSEYVPEELQIISGLTDEQIEDMILHDEKANIIFAAAALKRRADQEGMKITDTLQGTFNKFKEQEALIKSRIEHHNNQMGPDLISKNKMVGGIQILLSRYNDVPLKDYNKPQNKVCIHMVLRHTNILNVLRIITI